MDTKILQYIAMSPIVIVYLLGFIFLGHKLEKNSQEEQKNNSSIGMYL